MFIFNLPGEIIHGGRRWFARSSLRVVHTTLYNQYRVNYWTIIR